jgi:putative MATE family efflux protein
MLNNLLNQNVKKKVKVVLTLAVPTVIENFLITIVGFVDTLFVSKIGLHEVSAVGITNAIIAIYIAVFLAMGIGTSSLIARSIGAGELDKAKKIARQATIISGIIGLIFGIITLCLAEPLLRSMGIEDDVLTMGIVYFEIVGIPAIFTALMTNFGSILRSTGDSKNPMKVGIWINLIHIALDYVLIFGLGGWSGWGIAGAAWATTIVRMIGMAALYFYIQRSTISFSLLKGTSKEYTVPLLTISGPAIIERLIMRLGQLFYAGLIVRIGTDVYSAFLLAGNISYFSYMPGYGMGVAAATLVGNYIGAKRKNDAYHYGMVIMWIAVVFMSFIGVLYFTFSSMIGSWFTDDQNVIEMITLGLRIDAFAQPFIAISLVITGALQGAGDTKSPMYSTILGIWLIRVVGIYILCFYFTLGIAGVWLVNAIDYVLRSIFLFDRFRKGMQSGERNIGSLV